MPDFEYRGYQVTFRSYRVAGGQWLPEADVQRTTGHDVQDTTIRGESGQSFTTEEEANAEAKHLAIAWINAH